MLVAKTLQTMANQLRFGDKEPYMKPMNQFIEDNQLSLENYLRTLTQKPPKLQSQVRVCVWRWCVCAIWD
jgi:neurofibromin 1